jgi:tRNA(Ile)-lysidine synthetase-like protein
MALTEDYLARSAGTEERWEASGSGWSMSVEAFTSLHPFERMEAVLEVMNRSRGAGMGTLRIPYGAFRDIIEIPELNNNKVLFRYSGMRLQVRPPAVFLEPDIVFTGEKGYFMVVPESASRELRVQAVGSCVRIITAPSADGATAFLPIDDVAFPLIIRSRRRGDAIALGRIKKSVKALFSEWKVPEALRPRIAVCEDRRGVAAVCGAHFGYADVMRTDIAKRGSGKALIVEYSGENVEF